MAKFNFQLKSILKLNESLEEQKKNEFSKAVAELINQKTKLEQLYSEKKAFIYEFKNSLENHIDPKKNDILNKYIKLLNQRIEEQKKQVESAERFLETKRIELMEAAKEKKKLEKLKEKQFKQYLIEEKREEQKLIDEIVNYQNFSRINR